MQWSFRILRQSLDECVADQRCSTDADVHHQISPAITQAGARQVRMSRRVIGQNHQFRCGIAVSLGIGLCGLFQCVCQQCNGIHVDAALGCADMHCRADSNRL